MSAVAEADVRRWGVTVRPLQSTIGAQVGELDPRRPLSTDPRYAGL